jgi:hypothetical protein
MDNSTQKHRLGKACFMVVFVAAAFWMAVAIPSLAKNLSTADAAEGADVAGVKGVWSALSSSNDLVQAMRDAGYIDLNSEPSQPDWISQELFDISNESDDICLAANDYSSIAILREDIEDFDASFVKQQLELAGWAFHPTGIDGAYTAIKDQGRINWIYVQAVVSNDSTLYVIVVNN